VAVAAEMGVDYEEVRYMKDFPDEKTLRALIKKLEDPVERLVRKDSQFKKLELNEEDYVGNVDAVVEVLDRYHRLLERPVIVGPKTAIVGRPLDGVKAKDRLAEIFSS
jgi:arsenate reductase-like glutaredoxin family protein